MVERLNELRPAGAERVPRSAGFSSHGRADVVIDGEDLLLTPADTVAGSERNDMDTLPFETPCCRNWRDTLLRLRGRLTLFDPPSAVAEVSATSPAGASFSLLSQSIKHSLPAYASLERRTTCGGD